MSDVAALVVVLAIALGVGTALAFTTQLVPLRHRHAVEWLVFGSCLALALVFDSHSEGAAHGVSVFLFLALPAVLVYMVARFILAARDRRRPL